MSNWKDNPGYNQDVIIASGQQLSAAVDLEERTLCGMHMPAALTGIVITFYGASTLGGTYQPITDAAGAALSATVAAGKYVALDPSLFLGVRFLKVKSGSAEGASRTITLAARAM